MNQRFVVKITFGKQKHAPPTKDIGVGWTDDHEKLAVTSKSAKTSKRAGKYVKKSKKTVKNGKTKSHKSADANVRSEMDSIAPF